MLASLAVVAAAVAAEAGTAAPAEVRPAVLVHCARPSVDQWDWWVDLDYLAELHERGFEVDYTDRHADFTWERVKRYDVLVLYTVPLERGPYYDNSPDSPPWRDEFVSIVERFLEAGGGVLLLARSLNADETFLPLIERWGARIPHERIVETDPERVVPVPRMRGAEVLWHTDNVVPSPVSDGVEQVWLPLTPHYAAAETMPIEVSDEWQIVLRGAESSRTRPVLREQSVLLPPPRALVRRDEVRAPALFAIREYAAGRIAFAAMWPQYSIGQGTQWLYDRRVLGRGIGDRPSHFGRLLENTLHWLGESGLASAEVGGFVSDPARFIPPNERPGAAQEFVERARGSYTSPEVALAIARQSPPSERGLIGAQTALGSGAGTVADYARAARAEGLGFVVFLEDFARLDAARLARLRGDCAAASGDGLRLLPGYRIETNTGNTMFVYGDRVELPPPALVLDGELNLQYRDPRTRKPAPDASPLIDWINYRLIAQGDVTVGYYGFSPSALPLADLRLHSVVGIVVHRDGRLVSDDVEAYVESAAGTFPAVPVALHFVASPQALRDAAQKGRGLTRAAGRSDLFVSDGPVIRGFSAQRRYYTFAAETHVVEAARLPVPLVVEAEVGLREVLLYDGGRLLRRFLPDGARSFERVLELTASVQKTLIVVAEDLHGGRMVSGPLRAWKGGDLGISFCGDHVNHCSAAPLMATGPGIVQVQALPEIVAGHTWDGGPRGVRPLLELADAHRPALVSSRGAEGERGFANRPVLELADEGVVRVRSVLEHVYDEEVPVLNPWATYGPLGGPSRLLRAEAVTTVFNRPTIGPHPDAWPGEARRTGAAITLFEDEIGFRRDLRLSSLQLFRQKWYSGPFPVFLVHGRGAEMLRTIELSAAEWGPDGLRLRAGEWIGLYGAEPGNLTVLWNRGADLRVGFLGHARHWALTFNADLAGSRVRAGDARHYEVLSVVDPVDEPVTGEPRVLEIVRWLDGGAQLEVSRGRLDARTGVVELTATDGAVELTVGKPADAARIPLPVRVSGLNPRWSAGVALDRGYVLGKHGPGRGRYRDAGFDADGRIYETLFPDRTDGTHVRLGHPVVCDRPELFVQVTRRDDRGSAASWHVSVNNPTDRDVRASFRVAMDLPGLAPPADPVEIPAGGYVVLQGAGP